MLADIKDNIFIMFYGVALVLALFRYRKYYDSILKFLPIIIAYTFFTELLGNLVRYSENFQLIYVEGLSIENSIIYNIFDIITFLYFSFVYWKAIKNRYYRDVIKYSSITFILSCIINPFFQNFILIPQIASIVIGSFTLVLGTLFYLKEMKILQSSKSNSTNLLVWVSYGILIFYILYPIFMIIGLYFGEYYKELSIRTLHVIAVCAMYSFFIIGFIKMHRMKPLEEEIY